MCKATWYEIGHLVRNECAMIALKMRVACRERQLQYFWEVFPAQDGITTYMFAYTDPTPGMSFLAHPPKHTRLEHY